MEKLREKLIVVNWSRNCLPFV